jgi:predicted Fe-Mo cluster-binding NifX family protein
MIIAIAASEEHLKSVIDPHFGRCDWYCIYDSAGGRHRFIENTFRYQQEHAGTDAAAYLAGIGVEMAVAGRFGTKVIEIFTTAKIQMVVPKENEIISGFIKSIK